MMNSKERSLVLVLFAVFLPAIVTYDLIAETCNKTLFPDFCNRNLKSDFRSSTAKGPADLVIILLDQVDETAQSALTKINTLISHAQDPKLKEALSSCNERYIATVSQWLPFSKDSFTSGNISIASQYMTWASAAASRCEQVLVEAGSTMLELNDFVSTGAYICAAIAKSLI